ncbi:GyrI-like domain-containing protein [Noviherbaspirillum sp. Root189]|uniref:GyrI-like domain-containing protein n=1 Tax=Noviherbaspirillum sp. Root189 TaxID=1736487 RepID=UPI00070E5635|nr:GyrI-like domain-containing protein [Noviherbaspirillum sp. Root189]KRB84918.1 transcriptional regulator [Noviherbaspirillum sp. Root189]
MDNFAPNRFVDGQPMLLAGLRRRHEFGAMDTGIPKQWQDFHALGAISGRIGPNFYGVICGADATGCEYMCGVEVASLSELPVGMGKLHVPAQRYAVFVHDDHVSTLRHTWQQIFDWLPTSGFVSAQTPDFEVYGPEYDTTSGTGGTEVWIGVLPRDAG